MIARARLLTLTQLRAERLKPAPGQQPADRYWQGYGWVALYAASQAVALRPYKAPSQAQQAALAAGRALAGTGACRDCAQRVETAELARGGVCHDCRAVRREKQLEHDWRAECRAMARLLDRDACFIDTETTGLGLDAEIVEIAVLDRDGHILLDTLVRPVLAVPREASAIHGITDAMLASAPSWPAVMRHLEPVLRDRAVIAHNAAFDERMMAQTCARHALAMPSCATWACTLERLTARNGGRWPSLACAMQLVNVTVPEGKHHRAAFDAECCRLVAVAMAEICGSGALATLAPAVA